MDLKNRIWLWFKRTFQVGWFTTIVAEKCDETWTEEECPRPATCGEYHRGQFGHKVVRLFCDACYKRPDPLSLLEGREERRVDEDRHFFRMEGGNKE